MKIKIVRDALAQMDVLLWRRWWAVLLTQRDALDGRRWQRSLWYTSRRQKLNVAVAGAKIRALTIILRAEINDLPLVKLRARGLVPGGQRNYFVFTRVGLVAWGAILEWDVIALRGKEA